MVRVARSTLQPEENWSNYDSGWPSSRTTQLEYYHAIGHIRTHERKLASAEQDIAKYRQLVGEKSKISRSTEVMDDRMRATLVRDDGSNYVESYGANGELSLMPPLRLSDSNLQTFTQISEHTPTPNSSWWIQPSSKLPYKWFSEPVALDLPLALDVGTVNEEKSMSMIVLSPGRKSRVGHRLRARCF